jgi:murein DD-endopeptidase MepM/ murein hydrolase activator NlpD
MRLRVLLAGAVLPLALWAVLPVFSQGAASPSGRLNDIERKIEVTQGKIGRRKGTERLLTTQISGYSQRIGRLQSRIGTLQGQQANAQADLDAKRAELFQTQRDLRAERRRLVRLRARLAQARTALAERLVELYQADKPDIVTVIMSSKGFADLLERGEFMRRISDQDNQVITAVRLAKVRTKKATDRLAKLEDRQQRVTAAVLSHRNEVASVKFRLADARAQKADVLRGVKSERREAQEDLAAMEREQSRIQGTLNSGSAGPVRRGSGRFIWPVNGTFTSPFGMRWGRLHAGIDIAAPSGTGIRAADSGTVQIASWYGGYGNYTCIGHGGGISTCYGHQSSIGVSVGQNVSQGQVIGAVGSTGHSTGPHLHFEVRINGSPVDPMGYL